MEEASSLGSRMDPRCRTRPFRRSGASAGLTRGSRARGPPLLTPGRAVQCALHELVPSALDGGMHPPSRRWSACLQPVGIFVGAVSSRIRTCARGSTAAGSFAAGAVFRRAELAARKRPFNVEAEPRAAACRRESARATGWASLNCNASCWRNPSDNSTQHCATKHQNEQIKTD